MGSHPSVPLHLNPADPTAPLGGETLGGETLGGETLGGETLGGRDPVGTLDTEAMERPFPPSLPSRGRSWWSWQAWSGLLAQPRKVKHSG